MNKEIENKIDEIIEYIKNSNSYKKYLLSYELLSNRDDLKTIIDNIKKYQQEIIKNKSKEQELELKINKCLDILNNDPTYLEYTNYLNEVNNMLVIFENKLNKYFYDVFN